MTETRVFLRGADRTQAAERAAEAYAQGLSIRAVGKLLGVSYGTAHVLLTEAGVILRPRGARVREIQG